MLENQTIRISCQSRLGLLRVALALTAAFALALAMVPAAAFATTSGTVTASVTFIGKDAAGNAKIWATGTYTEASGTTADVAIGQLLSDSGMANDAAHGSYGFSLSSITSPDGSTTLAWDSASGSYWVLYDNGSGSSFGASGITLTDGESLVYYYTAPTYDASWNITGPELPSLSPAIGTRIYTDGYVYKTIGTGIAKLFRSKDVAETTVSVPATVRCYKTTCRVTTIAKNTFRGEKALRKVTLGRYVKLIGASAFRNCPSLVKVTFGVSISNIRTMAFYKDGALRFLVFQGRNLTRVGSEAFTGTASGITVKAPATKIAGYARLLRIGGISKKAAYERYVG